MSNPCEMSLLPARPATIAAAAGSGTAAIIVFAVMPVLVGTMAERFSLDDLQSGLIATAYFSTYAIVALASPLWIRRWNWRRTALAGFSLMLLSLLVTLSADDYATAQWSIAAVGIGAGLLFPISLTLASDMVHTERVFALKLTVEQLVPAGVLVLISLGWLIGSDMNGLVLAILVVVLVCGTVCFALPSSGSESGEEGSPHGSVVLGVLALSALGVSFAGFAGIWVFLERIATDTGFESAFTNRWLAVGLITSGLGPLLAACLGDRFGWIRPILFSITLALLSIFAFSGEITRAAYAVVLTVLPMAYYFAITYIMALVAAADGNGRMSGLMSFALAVGSASGPAIFGALRQQDGPVLLAMSGLIALGTLLTLYVALAIEKSKTQTI